MADIETEDDRAASLVPGAHRVVRTLDAKEGPFAGTLVTQGDVVVVRVDAASLRGWAGWRFGGAEHVAAPIDVGRRRGGHDALLPWCTDRVLGFLVRRTAAGAEMAGGECTTLVVSLLRGLDELGEGVDGVRTGVWWLTDGGRPVFVFGEGPDAREGVVEIVERLREHSSDKMLRRALGAIEEGLGKTLAQPRLPRKLTQAWEEELLSIAAPQPLERRSHAPERARDVARAVLSRDLIPASSGQRLRADRPRRADARRSMERTGFVDGAVRAVVGAVRATVAGVRGVLPSRTSSRARRQTSTAGIREAPASSRRRSLLVAGAAAAAVLAGGLFWPGGDDSGNASDSSTSVASETPSQVADQARGPMPSTTPEAPGGREEAVAESEASAAADPEVAMAELLKTIADCRVHGDTSCSGAVAAGSEGVVESLGAAEPGAAAELVDEYGDVAVIRLSMDEAGDDTDEADAEGVAQVIVVLIRTEEKWLVRDVYDVADQPG